MGLMEVLCIFFLNTLPCIISMSSISLFVMFVVDSMLYVLLYYSMLVLYHSSVGARREQTCVCPL